MKKLYSGALALVLVLGASMASAKTETDIDFYGHNIGSQGAFGPWGVPSVTDVSDDGRFTATVTAPGEAVNGYSIDGLGVGSSCCDLRGIQDGEVLRVDFNNDVDIRGITMRQWEGPDSVILRGYGDLGVTTITLDSDSCALCSEQYFTVNLQDIDYITLQGNSFATVAFLAELNNVSSVPLPAAAYLFGSALFGLVGISRRRKA